MRKILVLTSTRAEYGLLKGLIKEILAHPGLELCLVATGTHLSNDHGYTVSEIEADGFFINHKVSILDQQHGSIDVISAMTKMQLGLDKILKKDKPDVIVLLGDRYEIFAAASVALINHIPIAHIHGGELTLGAIDDAMRHGITKMAWWHYTTTEEYRKRVIRLGEDPERVLNVGAPVVDNIPDSTIKVSELEEFLGLKLIKPIVLATLHPETLSPLKALSHLNELWKALMEFQPGTLIFTMANADSEGEAINNHLKKLFSECNLNGVLIPSFGHKRYLSMLAMTDVAIGNSSSLVIEAPILGTPSINLGDRQKGRVRTPSVLDLPFDHSLIFEGLKLAISEDFKLKIKIQGHPFGTKGVSKKIVNHLASSPLPERLVKAFYE